MRPAAARKSAGTFEQIITLPANQTIRISISYQRIIVGSTKEMINLADSRCAGGSPRRQINIHSSCVCGIVECIATPTTINAAVQYGTIIKKSIAPEPAVSRRTMT